MWEGSRENLWGKLEEQEGELEKGLHEEQEEGLMETLEEEHCRKKEKARGGSRGRKREILTGG